MIAKDLISDIISVLRTSDTGLKALSYMDIFRISHMPIVNNTEFLGLISDKDIYDLNMADEPIGNHALNLQRPYVFGNQHVYEVIEIVNRLDLSVIPVLDDNKDYVGVITLQELVKYFAELLAIKNPGAIIILELNVNDYSLAHISQIVESNDAKILSTYISNTPDSTKLEITLKINTTDLTSIIQTFNRFNYIIKASFMENDALNQLLDDRLELFLRYLNI
jgi:predicted transcriptional regulator